MRYSYLHSQGARVYFTHFVLHDWPDHKCAAILRNIMAVMKPGYSKLLLNESILPNTGCASLWACGDILLMGELAGLKRSRRHWTELLTSVGLVDIKFWDSPDGVEGVIEASIKG